MNTENAIQQMRKGVVELCVLSLIASHGELYPAEVQKRLKEAGMDVVEGTLYPMLTRLKNSGHLVHRWVESTLGPPRKTYSMTDMGLAFLGELQNSWHEFVGSVNKVVAPQTEATETPAEAETIELVDATAAANQFIAEIVAATESSEAENAPNTEGSKAAKKSKSKSVAIND